MAIIWTVGLAPSVVPVLAAAVATLALARIPGFGWLGSGIAVTLALPFARAADVDLPQILGFPVQAQTAVIPIALIGAIASARPGVPRRLPAAPLIAVATLLVVGVLAALAGVLFENAARDIVRDARWWALYGVLGLVILLRIPSLSIQRGLLAGCAVFCMVVILAAVLPAFDGGLKSRALVYDYGTLRMYYANHAFVLMAGAVSVLAFLRSGRIPWLIFFGLILTVAALSVTRSYLGILLLVLLGTVAYSMFTSRMHRARVGARVLALGAVIAMMFSIGIAAVYISEGAIRAARDEAELILEDPVDRLTFGSDFSNFEAMGQGRFATYATAAGLIAERPLTGHGLGALIDVPYAFGGVEPHTPGKFPGVDNAYLTVAVKSGLVGAVVFGVTLVLPLVATRRRLRDPATVSFAIGWSALLALTLVESFATNGWGPFVVASVAAFPWVQSDRGPELAAKA